MVKKTHQEQDKSWQNTEEAFFIKMWVSMRLQPVQVKLDELILGDKQIWQMSQHHKAAINAT